MICILRTIFLYYVIIFVTLLFKIQANIFIGGTIALVRFEFEIVFGALLVTKLIVSIFGTFHFGSDVDSNMKTTLFFI